MNEAARELRALGAQVEAVEADLAATQGVDRLYSAARGRPVAALLANAGHGLGGAFLDQDFEQAGHVIDTNVTGTLYLIQKVGRDMQARGAGRILITGSIAGLYAGSLSGGLQRHQGVHRLLFLRAAQRTEGLRRHRHLPDAGG